MDFRRASAKDAPRIAEIEAETFSDPWSYRAVCDCICTEGAMCFVAESEGEIVAYWLGRLIPPEGELYRVAVIPKYRRRGIAYRLLDYGAKCSRGDGLETLFLEVRSENTAAFGLYCAFGFKPVARRRGYYKSPDDDAIVMIKERA